MFISGEFLRLCCIYSIFFLYGFLFIQDDFAHEGFLEQRVLK